MKAVKNSLAGFILFVLIASGSMITCEIGLGNSVDTKPPTVSITYPDSLSVIRGDFVIAGTAVDETALDFVEVSITAKTGVDTGRTFPVGNATIDRTTNKWTISVPAPAADGKYDVTAIAVDNANRRTPIFRSFIIDNTPPVLVLQRPSTRGNAITPDRFDPFGSELKFYGNWFDMNGTNGCVMSVNFFDRDGNIVNTTPYTKTYANQNWDFTIADDPNVNDEIWDLLAKKAGNNVEPFWYTITLADNAYEYKDPSNLNSGKTGNLTSHFYLYNELNSAVAYAAKENYPLLSALSTFENNLAMTDGIPKALWGEKLANYQIPITFEQVNLTENGNFTFEPSNTDPSVSITSLPVSRPKPAPADNWLSPLPTLDIKIEPNKSGTGIKMSSIQISLTPFNDSGEPNTSAKQVFTSDDLRIVTLGTTASISFEVDKNDGRYLLEVYAQDIKEEHDVTARFGFSINTGAPSLTSINPDNSPSNTKVNSDSNGKFRIVVVGTDGDPNVVLNLEENGTAPSDAVVTSTVAGTSPYTYTWTITLNAPAEGETRTLRFSLSDGIYTSSKREITFLTDDTPPVLISVSEPALKATGHVAAGKAVVTESLVSASGFASSDLEKAILKFTTSATPPSDSDLSGWTTAERANSITDLGLPTERRGFSATVPLVASGIAAEGTYYLWARFADDTYNATLQNYGAVTPVCTVIYDKSNPVLTETFVNTTERSFRTGGFTIGGKATDGNAVHSLVLTETYNGTVGSPVSLTPQSDGSWTSVKSAPAQGLYRYSVVLTDVAGNTQTLTRELYVDSIAPAVSITGGGSNINVTTTEHTFRGTVTETGSGVAAVQVSLDNGTTWTTPEGSTTWYHTVAFPVNVESATQKIMVSATDNAGNLSTVASANFTVDLADPRATIAAPLSSVTSANADVLFNGIADDAAITAGREAKTVELKYRKNGGSAVLIPVGTALNQFNHNATTGAWSWTLDAGALGDGQYEVTLSVVDIVGKLASAVHFLRIDTTAPSLDITTPAAGQKVETQDFTISGISTDGTGIGFDGTDDVQYSWNSTNGTDGDWTTFTGSEWTGYNWTKLETIPGDEGAKTLYVRTADALGDYNDATKKNWTSKPVAFYYDKATPTLDVTGITGTDQVIKSTGYDLIISASDSNGLKSLTINATKDGVPKGNLHSWTATDTATKNYNHTYNEEVTDHSKDGLWVYTITTVDQANRETTTLRTVLLDTTAPILSVTPFAVQYYADTQLSVSGTASDATSGVFAVEYSIDANKDDINNDAWIDATGTASWFKSGIDISDQLEGTRTIWFRATDKAGNASDASTTFTVDHNNPELTVDASFDGVVYKDAAFTISGTVSDTLDLAATPIVISAKKGASVHTITTPAVAYNSGTGAWSRSINIDGSGTYEITITAIDGVGRPTVEKRTVTVDQTPPTVEMVSFTSYATGTKVNGEVTFNAIASDVNGLDGTKYFISTENVNPGYEAEVGSPAAVVDVLADQKIDTTSLSDNTTYYLWVVAKDRAGNTAGKSKTFEVDQSTDLPVVTPISFDASIDSATDIVVLDPGKENEKRINLFANSESLKATITDDDGLATIEVLRDETLVNSFNTSEKTYDLNISITTLGLTQNIPHKITIKVKDSSSASKLIEESFYIAWDIGNPTITVTGLDGITAVDGYDTDGVYSNLGFLTGTKTISGTAVGSFSISSVILNSLSKTGGSGVTNGASIGDESWTFTLVKPASSVAELIAVTASDSFGRNVIKRFSYIFDLDKPTVSPSLPANQHFMKAGGASVSGSALDTAASVPVSDRVTQSGVDSIEYTIVTGNNTPYPGTPIPDGYWTTLSIPNASSWTNAKITDFTTRDDGWYTIHFRSKDKSGNYSDPVRLSYYADSAAPVITTTKDGTSLATNKWYEKGTFVLAGTLSEATYEESGLAVWTYDRYYQADVEASYGMATDTNVPLTLTTIYPAWSITETAPHDGKYKYVITAKDRAGYTTVITREIFIDTTAPTLAVSNIASGNVISTNDYTYRGTLTDSPAGPNKVYYQLTQDPSPADISLYPVMTGYTEVNAMTNSWTINKGNIEGTVAGTGVNEGKLHEGKWYLHLAADDTAGNVTSSVVTVPFIVDLKNPVVDETVINSASTVDRTGLFNMTVTAEDTNALKNLTIVQKRNGTGAVTIRNIAYTTEQNESIVLTNLPHTNSSNTSVAVDGSADGLYTYDITLTDFADKTHTITRSVRFDTQAPVIAVTAPTADNWYSSNVFTASGSLSDTGSGAKNIHYAITATEAKPNADAYIPVSTVNTWTITKDVDTGLSAVTPGNLYEGVWYLHLRAEDQVGNITDTANAVTVKFNLDRGNPVVTESVSGSDGVGTGTAVPKTGLFSLNLGATDSHALASLTIVQKKNGAGDLTVYNNTVLSGTSIAPLVAALPYTSVGPNVSASTDGSDDGLYTYDITLTDIAGKTHSITRSVRFDTKAPVVTIVTPAAGTWNGSASLNVTGNASDDSGVAAVRYTVVPGAPGAAPADPLSWTAFTGTTSLTASLAGLAEGENTLWIYAADTLGNSNASSLMSHAFKVDTLVPSLSVTGGTSARYILTGDTTVSFAGTASDTAELDSVTISVGSYSQTINAPLAGNNWTAAAINVGKFTANTANIVEITAYDKYGRTKQEKVTVYRDTLAPVTTVTTVNQLLDFGGYTNAVNGTVTISGTLSDNTGIAGYRYTLSRSGYTAKEFNVPGAASNFSISLNTLDPAITDFTGDLAADDNFVLTVLVESYDASGNVSVPTTDPAFKTEFTLYVDQDSDKPIITLDTFAPPVGGRYVFTTAEQIGATITDDDGIASTERTIGSGSLVAASPVPAIGSRSGRFVQKLSGLAEGPNTLTITVKDNATGEETTKTILIAIDNNNPVILSDLPVGQFRSASFDITLTVTDNAGINGNPGAVPKVADSTEDTGITVSAPVVSGSNYTYTVSIDDPSSFTETEVEILFTALDMYNKSSSYNFTYKVDLTKPVFDSITYPASDYINLPDSYTYRVTGSVTDEVGGSGLNDVRYVVLDGDVDVDFADSAAVTAAFTASSTTWKPAAGLSPWTANVDMSGKASGAYSLYIMVRDNAGNETVAAKQLIYADTAAPTITPDAVSALNRIDFILSGTASDTDNFLKSVTAKVVNGSSLTTSAGHTKDMWKFDVSTATLGNGPKQVEVTAEDESGKKVSQTVSFTIDTVPPTVSFTNIEGAAVTEATTPAGYTIVTKLTGTSQKVLGTFSDVTSGLKSIAYSYQRWNGSAWVELETDSETKTSSVTSGTISRDLTAYSNTTTNPGRDGIWRVRAVATDDAGNSSAEIYSPLFIVDRTLPTVDITDPLENSIKKIEDPLLIAGNAADSNGGELDRVEITISHPSYTPAQTTANKTSILASAMTGGVWSWNRAGGAGISPFIYSGNYTITVIAYDKGGNIREATRRVSCDTTPPPINFTRPYLLPVTAAGFHGTAPKAGGIYPNPQVGTLIGDVLIQGSIPSAEFSNDKIYYQAGGELTVTKGGSVITINDEWFTELNDTTGVITDIGISGGFLTAGAVTPEATTGVTGSWLTTTDKWNFSFNIDTIALKNAGKLYQTPGTVLPNLQTVNVYVVSIDSAGNKNVGVYPINLDTDTDKPIVEILSPEPFGGYVDLGGSFTVSGNVTDNTFVYDVYMKVELENGNYDGNGDLRHNATNALFAGTSITAAGITSGQSYSVNGTVDATDFTNGVTDYFTNKNNWYKVNYNSATGGWKIKLNGDGEFFNLNLEDYYLTGHPYDSADKAVLNVSVMAIDSKDAHNTLSDGSLMGNEKAIIVRIDGDNPGISLDVFPDANTYVSGSMPVKVTYTDNVSVSTYSLYAGSTKIFDQASSAGWTVTTVPAVAPYTSVTLEGTINTTTLPTQTIFRLDVEDDGSRVSSMMRTVYVDNDKPRDVLNGVLQPSDITTDPPVPFVRTDSYLTISSTEAELAGKASDLVGSIEGSGIKHIVLYLTKGTGASTKIYNTELRSGGVHTKDTDGTLLTNQVSVSKFNGATYETATVYFPEASIGAIRPNKEAVTNSIAATPYVVIDSANENSDGDKDYYRENLKANKAWSVMLDSTMIPDGLYDVNYLVVDNAGNAAFYTDQVLVANNPPKIKNVILATNINGDGTLEHNEFGDAGDEDFAYTLAGTNVNASDFTAVNNTLVIRVNTTENTGTPPLEYYLEYPTTTGSDTMHNDTGIFEVTVFPNDAEDVEYKVWVNDSVEPGISLSSSVVTIKMNIDHDDDVLPLAQLYTLNTIRDTAALAPLTNVSGAFINNTLGSLFISSVAPKVVQGHIETRSTSPYNNTGGADSDVSGEIILRGRAYDNQRISTISLEINGVTIPIIDANASGRLKVVTGQELRVMVADKIGLAGHEAEWSYIWNTASVDGVARDNVEVKVIVEDANSKVNDEVPYVDEAVSYDSTTYDVVPYITFITTPKRTNSGLKSDNIRSSSGKYSVITGTDAGFITVDGFNLNPVLNSARIVSSSDVTGVVTTASGIGINNSAGSGTYKQITVSNNSTKSGYLELFVNGIRTINNINNNDLDSNKEPNLITKNTTLNDDRYLRFFTASDTGIKNGYYPTMLMNGDNPVFGYIDSSAQYDRQFQRREVNLAGVQQSLSYIARGLSWDQMAMARDAAGRYFMMSSHNYAQGQLAFIYNEYASCYMGTAYDGGYHTGAAEPYWNTYPAAGDFYSDANNNALSLDSIDHGSRLIDRYKNLKLIVKGNSTIASDAQVYSVYYDDNPKVIYYRGFQVGPSPQTSQNNLYTATSGGINYNNVKTNLAETSRAAYSNATINNSRKQVTATGTQYFDFGVTSDNRVVVVYYDEALSTLMLTYSTTAQTGANPTDAVAFSTPVAVGPAYTGTNISLVIDGSDRIHIAAYDGSNGDLMYIFVPSYATASSYVAVPVDSSFSVGLWTQIKIRNNVPYIAYYNSSESGTRDSLKFAYCNSEITSTGTVVTGTDEDFYVTDNWEVMTVPAKTPPQGGNPKFKQVNLDFDSSGNPILGYLGTNIEFSREIPE